MIATRKSYESSLEAQLVQWRADIDVLKAEAARAGVETRLRYNHTIEAMQLNCDEASHHLNGLKEASDEVWESAKRHTEAAWVEIKAIIQNRA